MRDANHPIEDCGYTGFAATGRAGRRNAAVAELVATVVLTVSTLIAATAVSIGFARADTLGGSPFAASPFATLPRTDALALAVLLGLLFIGLSGMAAGLSAWRRRMWRNRYRYD
jgi:hypothetical protein